MDILTLFGIAFALAMDTVAVALAAGIGMPSVSVRTALRLSWHFGFFQSAMPIIGWAAGQTVRPLIERYDHWAAFAMLFLVGGNMIREAAKNHTNDHIRIDPTRGLSLVVLSFATSIDALAVGLSFAMLGMSVLFPALVIGLVTACCTAAGLYIGRNVAAASRLERYADVLGGVVLIAIGLKILIAHGVFATP